MNSRNFLWGYAATCCVVLANRAFNAVPVMYYTLEPATVAWLLGYLLMRTRGLQNFGTLRLLMAFALAACIAGEYVVRFAEPNSFLYGVAIGLFLVGNLAYNSAFALEIRTYRKPFYLHGLWWLAPLGIGILVLALQMLWPGVGNVRIILTIHGVSFVTLLLMAAARWHAVSDASFFSVIIGCILLALGNLLYAVNAVVTPLPLGMFFNLATYYAGQFYLVIGVVQQITLNRTPERTVAQNPNKN